MLHFVSRFADWLQGNIFKGAALPGWMKKELPRRVATLSLHLCSIAIASCVVYVVFLTTDHYVVFGRDLVHLKGLLWGASASFLWWNGCVPATRYLRREWSNRHQRIFFYRPAGTTEWVFMTAFHGPAREFDSQLGALLFALPVSRLFGEEEWRELSKPEGIRLTLREEEPIGWWIDVAIKDTGHLYIGEEKLHAGDVRALAALRQIHRFHSDARGHFGLAGLLLWNVPSQERGARLDFWYEAQEWLKVLRASKKAAGSSELKALADRMEYVLARLRTDTLEPIVGEGAPELIVPQPKERRRGVSVPT